MAQAGITILTILATTLALGACVPGGTATDGDAAAAPVQRSTRLVDRDVEAPDVFQVTDSALWDGRPSLGGVWVASADASDPERVIMRNPANGKFVIGALFRRERDNPGPALQISSDAAEALGLLAGQPSQISVTALRREEVPEEAPTSPVLDTAETLPAEAGAIDAGGVETKPLDGSAPAAAPAAPAGARKPADAAAVASAALDAVEGKPAAAAPAAPAAPAPKAPAAASGGRPIQIGFFSVEANAKRAVDTLAKAGVPAEMRKESSNGKDYWSVIARGDAALLQKIKSAGFADAYLLK